MIMDLSKTTQQDSPRPIKPIQGPWQETAGGGGGGGGGGAASKWLLTKMNWNVLPLQII